MENKVDTVVDSELSLCIIGGLSGASVSRSLKVWIKIICVGACDDYFSCKKIIDTATNTLIQVIYV